MLEATLQQAAQALAYYLALVVIMRIAGKRLAGQMQTLDLIILITLGVVLQQTSLEDGTWNALVFVVTVFCAHRALNWAARTSPRVRALVRLAARAGARWTGHRRGARARGREPRRTARRPPQARLRLA